MATDSDQPDASSIKPVSSLRSQFESLKSSEASASRPKPAPKPPKLSHEPRLDAQTQRTDSGRRSFELPRSGALANSAPFQDGVPDRSITPVRRRAPSPPKLRPTSMIYGSSPRQSPSKSPPRVNISSPTSPPKQIRLPGSSPTRVGPLTPAGRHSQSPYSHASGNYSIPTRHDSLPGGSQKSASIQALDLPTNNRLLSAEQEARAPPMNRAAKPRIASKDLSSSGTRRMRRNDTVPANQDRKVSPFNTPPGSDESSTAESPADSSASSPPSVPIATKPVPSIPLQSVGPIQKQALTPRSSSPRGRNIPSPTRSPGPALRPPPPPVSRQQQHPVYDGIPAPALPPRRQTPTEHQEPPRTVQPVSQKSSALVQGFSAKTSSPSHAANAKHHHHLSVHSGSRIRSRTPSSTGMTNGRRSPQKAPPRNAVPGADYVRRDRAVVIPPSSDLSEYPDSSHANRRPPYFSDAPQTISVGYDSKLFDVCSDLVCATGVITRVWSLLTGKLLLNIPHGDTVRVTALCFKPARKIEDEGARIWLGTNLGEVLEVDVAARRVIASNTTAHARREITKLHRHGTEIWSLDEEGKLIVWPAGETGTPDISRTVPNGRVPRRPTASLVVRDELWLAFGKDVRIVTPSSRTEIAGQQSSPQKALVQAPGDITSAAVIGDQPDKVYFGQADGKISIFSRPGCKLLETISVSLYKISSLVAVGSYLWSGHSTGTIFVYDTASRPWRVQKDWPAHESFVASISNERNSLWKLNRLPVVSLGASNLHIWDGMLQDDWTEGDLEEHQVEYCEFDELSSLILTWNVGAARPADLRYDEEDSNFFRELFSSGEPPDVLAFGLQELVDLEDKKLTAKSFFKSKHKDMYGQEHLSSVYRAWRDHLSHCLDESTPMDEPYALLHSASLVGLFSSVFVKSSLKHRIHDVQAAEVKTGMGGLHGNKGAILIRLVLDDSSICFVNCHLAAGQNQTMNRNNDVASILETAPLDVVQTSGSRTEIFTGGGDGSMILDNESCILNGDLNYRLDTMSRDAVVSAVKQKSLDKLLERDQLILSRRKHPGFRLRNFHEGQITFAPTYKYDVGTDTYDTSEKRRAPAWCDRILYRGQVQQLEYRRHEVRVSDHRPVSSRFRIRVKTIRQDLRPQCLAASKQRFEAMKKRVSDGAKLDYLHDVFGLSAEEGQKLLEG